MERLAAGQTCHEGTAALKVAPSSVIKWAQRQRRTSNGAPGKMGGHRARHCRQPSRPGLSMIEGPDHVTLQMLAAGLSQYGLKVHPTRISRFLHREGRRFK